MGRGTSVRPELGRAGMPGVAGGTGPGARREFLRVPTDGFHAGSAITSGTRARPGEVTLREVLLREWEIVQTAKEGVGDCLPLVANPRPPNPQLDDEQRQALEALLRSTNSVSVFRGGAGTGKSFVLRELVEQLRQSGRRVVVLAPQRQQVVDMEKAGFPSPTTVANFLLKRELADSAVVVVDEAGQIGGRQMLELCG